MTDDQRRRTPDRREGDSYRAARIGTAAALTGVLVFLLILDGFSSDYSLNEVTLAAIGAMILTLYGIEAASIIGRKK